MSQHTLMMKHAATLLVSIWLLSVGYLWHQQARKCHELTELVDKLKVEVNTPAVVAQVPEEQRILPNSGDESADRSVARRWSELHPLFKDTVVQIFVQVVDFNWLEPYKSPNQHGAVGSGFFIDDIGHIITNWHVVNQACAVSIQIPSMGKRRFDVEVIGVNPDRDLALLRLKDDDVELLKKTLGKIPYLLIGDSDQVRRSDEIMTLGYPLGQQALKSTTGVVSGRENIEGHPMIQISAPINPGNSGGPSVDQHARVVGVNTAGYQAAAAQNVNYIIPSNEVKLFLQHLKQMEKVERPANYPVIFLRRPFLGVLYNNATDSLAEFLSNPLPGGLYVVAAYKGSPLHKAGVRAGDMIYEIDGHRIDTFGELNVPWSEDKISIVDYVSRLMLGDRLHLTFYRNGKRMDTTFKFEASEPPAVRRVFPGYEEIDYEIVGGLVVMQLTLNHLPLLLQYASELAKYAEIKHQMKPVLVVTHVMADSPAYRSRALLPGLVLSEVAGRSVQTLSDFRGAVRAAMHKDFLTIKTTENVFVALSMREIITQEARIARIFNYDSTPLMRGIIEESAAA